MQPAEINLDAAIRDANASRKMARHQAIRSLAPALLQEISQSAPLWQAARLHPQGEAVIEKLRAAARNSDDDAALAGIAAASLGMLGDPDVLKITSSWWDEERTGEGHHFLRESAAIAASYLGVAAREHDAALVASVIARMRAGLVSPRPELRYQCALGLIEVTEDAEAALVATLEQETDKDVRLGLVEAIAKLSHMHPTTCDLLAKIISDDKPSETQVSFQAALSLATARRQEAGPRLCESLERRHERDLALETLAFLGEDAPSCALPKVSTLLRGMWTPAVTRVRAAYALCRIDHGAPSDRPNLGRIWLKRLSWHPRRAVREAVADAYAALHRLDG